MHLADQFLIALGRSVFWIFVFLRSSKTIILCRNAFITVYLWRLEIAGRMSLGNSVWHSLTLDS